jgi:ubiquitin-conjugating enzyme E2 D/E
MALRRITKELRDIERDTARSGVVASPVDADMFHWKASIQGPAGSPYEGGKFFLDVTFPDNYPMKPPTLRFVTKVYHPNINDNGDICVDLLHDQWSPVLGIAKLLLSVSSLLTDPNTDHGLRPDVVKQLKSDPLTFTKTAREWTARFAQ